MSNKSTHSPESIQASDAAPDSRRLIKKYPNRRLYDTKTSGYITLQEVKAMVIAGVAIRVVDAKSNADLTRSIYLQILLEEETAGIPMFSEEILENFIRFYGHSMQGFMGSYLEKNVQAFLDIHKQMNEQAQSLSPEIWTQMMTNPSPFLQTMMGTYAQQSQQLLSQMQTQLLNSIGLTRK